MNKIKLTLTMSALILSNIALADLNDGLIAYYPFDGNADDMSGHGYNGTVNGATLTTDKLGNPNNAYSFNGVDDYINVGNVISNFNQFSFGAWIKINSVTNADYMGIFGQQEFSYPPVNNNYWMFYVGKTSAFGTSGSWSDGTYIETRVKHNVPINSWHFIMQTYDGNSVTQYDNGVRINTTAFPNKTLGNNSQDFLIGKVAAYPTFLDIAYFDGVIDDVRIYNRALSSNEVKQLYNSVQPVSGTIKGIRSYSVTCTNLSTKQVKIISTKDGLNGWDCKRAGLVTTPNQQVEIKLLGNTY